MTVSVNQGSPSKEADGAARYSVQSLSLEFLGFENWTDIIRHYNAVDDQETHLFEYLEASVSL